MAGAKKCECGHEDQIGTECGVCLSDDACSPMKRCENGTIIREAYVFFGLFFCFFISKKNLNYSVSYDKNYYCEARLDPELISFLEGAVSTIARIRISARFESANRT